MSFAGSVLAMIQTLKNNANLLSKRKTFKDIRQDYRISVGHPLKFKEVSDEELEQIKSRIRKKIIRHRRKRRISINLVLILVLIPISFLVLKLTGNIESLLASRDYIPEEVSPQRRELSEEEINSKRTQYYLNEGYRLMAEGNYTEAKIQINKVVHGYRGNYDAILAYTRAYVYDCVDNNRDCDVATEMVTRMLEIYEDKEELIELKEIMVQEK